MCSSFELSSSTTQGRIFSFSDMLAVHKRYKRKEDLLWLRGEVEVQSQGSAMAWMKEVNKGQRYIFGKVKPGHNAVPF